MDRFTIRNLELYHSTTPGAVTLIDVIDKTASAMGSRMLKRWLAFPLKSEYKINQRLENVSLLKSNFDLQTEIRSHLKQISDIERLISKVATLKINPRELLQT